MFGKESRGRCSMIYKENRSLVAIDGLYGGNAVLANTDALNIAKNVTNTKKYYILQNVMRLFAQKFAASITEKRIKIPRIFIGNHGFHEDFSMRNIFNWPPNRKLHEVLVSINK